jgi:hypothetical protein
VSDHRYFISTNEAGATRALDMLSAVFEDEGYPIATMEVDEDKGIWEASLYAAGDPDPALEERVRICLQPAFDGIRRPNRAVRRCRLDRQVARRPQARARRDAFWCMAPTTARLSGHMIWL